MFTTPFDSFVCEGDKITCENEGFTIEARIERDPVCDTPDERDEGFWPSKCPNDPGYIGENPAKSYDDQMKEAQAVLDAWKNDEWFYCGVVLSVAKNGIMLDKHAASLWGIECNYPNGGKNAYLMEVANELLSEAIETGKNLVNNKQDFLEKIIREWVIDNFDENEADDPSWNIEYLAEHIASKL